MQEKNGYMVQIKRDGERSFILEKQNCPLKEIAEKFPQVCEDEKDMYKRLFTGANVKALTNMCVGDCNCSYQIKEEKMNVMGRFKVKRFFLLKKGLI